MVECGLNLSWDYCPDVNVVGFGTWADTVDDYAVGIDQKK
jgi:hypothetical protein